MALSVIVTSYESPASLRSCLHSLSAQPDAQQIIVSDCSSRHPAQALQSEFANVHFLQFQEPHSVPQLRWAALRVATGNVVAAVEARCIPSSTWCAELLAGHVSAPGSPAVGGAVAIAEGSSNFDWALYLCEYGAFAPPIRKGPVRALSGANLSYKRSALDACADLTQRGEWETLIHERWFHQGMHLTLIHAPVVFVNSMSIGTAFAQRWHYGRGYASDRTAAARLPLRCLFALGGLALPLVMTIRLARAAARKRLLPRFLKASGWILALNMSWSMGEIAGYLLGRPATPKIF